MKRFADRVMPRRGWPAVVYFAAVATAVGATTHLPIGARLTVTGLASLAGGAWCAVNFWRCRHAHCLVTGTGWLLLGVAALVGAGTGSNVLDGLSRPLFVGVLAMGVVFEAGVYLTSGSVTLDRSPTQRRRAANGVPHAGERR